MAATTSIGEAIQAAFRASRDMDAPVNERLAAFAAALAAISPPFSRAVERLIDRLRRADIGRAAPRPGEVFPSFHLPDENGHVVTLDNVLAEGPAAIVFHRGHWCPYCRINTRALAEAMPEVRAAGGNLVAILPDRQNFANQLKQEAQADFSILSDMDNGYALSLGLAFWVGSEMEQFIAAERVSARIDSTWLRTSA